MCLALIPIYASLKREEENNNFYATIGIWKRPQNAAILPHYNNVIMSLPIVQ